VWTEDARHEVAGGEDQLREEGLTELLLPRLFVLHDGADPLKRRLERLPLLLAIFGK